MVKSLSLHNGNLGWGNNLWFFDIIPKLALCVALDEFLWNRDIYVLHVGHMKTQNMRCNLNKYVTYDLVVH